ncbi:CidA/LrgA family protein [Oceanobacillus senegalensis]|uniref:CidA/LrgA family protein n=1 Tax=Oceanobacillus senegalensis TaxID=1936063 RepID=UPI000A3113B9|nr:CidA/LrgA family protein [Oceanobacillus senegalensis]
MLKFIKITLHVAILYCFYQLGNFIQQTFNLFIPGSVIGMVLLFLFLFTNIVKVSWLEDGLVFMNKHLTLFFIPVTVGIINYFELFKGKGFLLVVIVIFSTLLVMISSGLISQSMARRKEIKHEHD